MKQQKGFANVVLIILIVVLVGALGYVALVKKPVLTKQLQPDSLQNTQLATSTVPNNTVPQNQVSTQPPVNTSKIDCGVIKDELLQNIQVACMSKAFRTCTSAIMYDSSKNPIAQESYEILGSESQYCQVRHRQYTKPPQFSLVCKYSLDQISKTDSTLESKNESDKLFSAVVMQSGFSCQ